MIVVDTNVWSETTKPTPEPRVVSWLLDHQAHAALTTITVGEMLVGLELLPEGRRRAELTRTVERLIRGARPRTFPYDEAAARAFAAVVAERRRSGRPVGNPEDAMIAAIARSRDLPIATRNTDDFDGMGVELINPWE